MKILVKFFQKPVVYKSMILIALLIAVYTNIIAPLTNRFWQPEKVEMRNAPARGM
jgi:hypothetical protein